MLLNRVRAEKMMDKYDVDAVIGISAENVTYLCDWLPFSVEYNPYIQRFAVILPRDRGIEPATLSTSYEFLSLCEGPSWIKDNRVYGQLGAFELERGITFKGPEARVADFLTRLPPPIEPTFVDALVKALNDKGLADKKLGLEFQPWMSPMAYEQICKRLPSAVIRDAWPILRETRMVKTEEEIRRLREAHRIADVGFEAAFAAAKEGVTERKIFQEYALACVRAGSTLPVPGVKSVCGGRRSAFATDTTDYALKKGDLLKIDISNCYQHYRSDLAREGVVGKPTDKQKKYYDALLQGEQEAIAAMKPGTKVSELYDIAVKTIRKAGILHYRRTHAGHAVGLMQQDGVNPCHINPYETTVLEAGMTFEVECPYLEIGWGGINIEDGVLVTEHGPDFLSKGDRKLWVV